MAVATREQLAKRGDWGGNRVRVLASEKGRAAAVPAAQRAFAGGVSDAADALAVAQAVAKTGAHEDARVLFETLTRWAPNRAPVWAGLAQELSAAPADATGNAVIAASLRRARELEPAEARYRAELELRTKPSSKEAETHDDERYLVPSETVLARRVGVTRSPGTEAPDVSERDLYWLRAVVMHADRRVSEMVQYAHEVVIAPRTEDELYEDIRSEGDQTEILRARVHRKDGTEAFPVEEANEHASPRIRWPELAPGDVCEVAFRSWTAGPVGGRGDPPFYRLDYAGALTTHPLLYNRGRHRSRRRTTPSSPAWSTARPIAPTSTTRTGATSSATSGIIRRPSRTSRSRPRSARSCPVLVMSTFKDWNAFRAGYSDAVHGFTEPDAQVRAIAAKLTKGKTTRDEKLRALFDFVADDIRYVNYVSGEWWLPNRPQQLLARREGDCDDKALLLITLLKAAGIEAQEVMVQTRLTNEPSIVRAKDAAIPLFDHGIAFLPGPGGGTYLDATSPQSRLGPLPSMDARAPALQLDGAAGMVSLPSSSPDDHGVDSTWTVKLAPSGSAELEGDERAIGDEAFWMRTNLTEPDARAQWVEDHLVGPWFATVEVGKKVDFQGDLGRGVATVKWKARSDRARSPRRDGARRAPLPVAADGLAGRAARAAHGAGVAPVEPGAAQGIADHPRRGAEGVALRSAARGRRRERGPVRARSPGDRARPARSAGRRREAVHGLRPERDRRGRVPPVARLGPARRRADAQGAAARGHGRRAMRPLRGLVLAALGVAACGGPGARTPDGPRGQLPRAFAVAFRAEAVDDPRAATRAYLDVVRSAAPLDGDPWQVGALEASLDALALRTLPSLGEAGQDGGLVWRTGDTVVVGQELAKTDARGPFARGLIAAASREMAERRGDAAEAERQRAASGCAREAVVLGPTTWASITGVDEAGPLDRADARLEAGYPRGDAFERTSHPISVRAEGCELPLSVESARPGVREVVVDVDVPRDQVVGLVLRAHGAAALHAGGKVVVRRPFELGDGAVPRFARVAVRAGTLRLVARVGTARDDDSVEIDAFDEAGAPLKMHAPAVGSSATSAAGAVTALDAPAPHGTDEALLAAAAALAAHDPRTAESLLWGLASPASAPPELALVYARAIDTARDLSVATRAERERSAYERVLAAWPSSWEGTIAHAVLAGVRRGRDEASVEILRDLDARRAKIPGVPPPIVDAFEAVVAGRDHLFDRARFALDRARAPLAGTAILADAERAATPRSGAELVAAVCDPGRRLRQDTTACFDALRATGEDARAAQEISRLRALEGAPSELLAAELRDALARGDVPTANRAFDAMLPAARSLSSRVALNRLGDLPVLTAFAVDAPDAPAALMPLLHAAGDDPGRELDAEAQRIAAQDRGLMPTAATAVLAHAERYELAPDGLLHWLLFDVRRVSGTTDVEENAQASAPDVWARGAARAIRRRILKKDGRVLDPDPTPHASQSHADLSQLEQGDVVEAVYEGGPSRTTRGNVGIDTPDMLPDRTAVHQGTIELRLPRQLHGSLWSHPLLGKPEERVEGDARVLRWRVFEHPERRTEYGVPSMDRSARVSFTTAEWSSVARALREAVAALDDHEPELAAWAHDAVPSDAAAHPTRATVEAVVAAAGKALREADAGALSDYAGGVTAVQTTTARSSLSSHDGSRSWLIVRALRELGIPSDLVVSESAPFSADPAFPPHYGRFVHPLVVAHVEGQPVWIDADVDGPPLPAGRISPELRGRFALSVDGTIAPLPATADPGVGDEIDVRLALDAHGDARGTFAVVLRGRDAQTLAQGLVTAVGAARQRALRDVVLAWLPWANVDDVQLASSEGSWQVSLRAQVTVGGYAQLEGTKTWLLPGLDTMHSSSSRAHVSSLGATFATRSGRESALALNRAVQYHVHRRIELPRGATVVRMPGPLELKATLVDASRKFAVGPAVGNAGLVLEDDFALGVTTGTIPAKNYETFVAIAHEADDGFLASTRISMP